MKVFFRGVFITGVVFALGSLGTRCMAAPDDDDQGSPRGIAEVSTLAPLIPEAKPQAEKKVVAAEVPKSIDPTVNKDAELDDAVIDDPSIAVSWAYLHSR